MSKHYNQKKNGIHARQHFFLLLKTLHTFSNTSPRSPTSPPPPSFCHSSPGFLTFLPPSSHSRQSHVTWNIIVAVKTNLLSNHLDSLTFSSRWWWPWDKMVGRDMNCKDFSSLGKLAGMIILRKIQILCHEHSPHLLYPTPWEGGFGTAPGIGDIEVPNLF